MAYYITPNYSVSLIPKSGCSTIARLVLKSFYPDKESLIQTGAYPEGKGPDNTLWQGFTPKEKYPSKPVISFIREPIERFLSAMSQENLIDVDLTIDSIINSTPLPPQNLNGKRKERLLSRNPHFSLQIKQVTPTAKLYKFPDHLTEGSAEIGFVGDLVHINSASRPKPSLTQNQINILNEIYAEDILLYNSIVLPGIVTGQVWSQYSPPPPPEPVDDEILSDS